MKKRYVAAINNAVHAEEWWTAVEQCDATPPDLDPLLKGTRKTVTITSFEVAWCRRLRGWKCRNGTALELTRVPF